MARFSMPSAITDRPNCLLSPMVELTIAASSGLASNSDHEGAVDLEPVEREFLQIAEARIAGAEIVEHDADAERLDLQERVERALFVVQQDVLGDFEFEQLVGLRPVRASACATEVARSPDWNCDGDRLTPMRSLCPARSQARGLAAGGFQHPVRDPLPKSARCSRQA